MFGVVGAVFVGHIPAGCSPHELFLRVFQASKVKPEAGVERRGGLKSNGFDQIDQKRSPVTNEIEHNAYISDSVPVGL